MKLFHGSYSNTAPVIKIGAYALGSLDNVFDGLFASPDREVAASHGGNCVYSYVVDDGKIATSSDLDARYEEVYAFLVSELNISADDVAEIADRVMSDDSSDITDFAEILSPRSDAFDGGEGDLSWELQRLRGRVAAHLGYDAVEMDDEHGTSYLIVNPAVTAE
ncbi:hypothetical protein [Rouxiella sp. Mn2063]|uniref:hypothetical protein n=1 Tax=Rouxiella sp. Mn2063 TaxID=3395262 RepID=UPI003BDC2685